MTGRGIIIASDASWHGPTKTGGWAGAALMPDDVYAMVSGAITDPCGGSNAAEMLDMAKTLAWALAAGHVIAGAAVVLLTDSQHVCKKLEPQRISRSNPVGLLVIDHGLDVELVKADGHPDKKQRKRSRRMRAMAWVHNAAYVRMNQQRAVVLAQYPADVAERMRYDGPRPAW